MVYNCWKKFKVLAESSNNNYRFNSRNAPALALRLTSWGTTEALSRVLSGHQTAEQPVAQKGCRHRQVRTDAVCVGRASAIPANCSPLNQICLYTSLNYMLYFFIKQGFTNGTPPFWRPYFMLKYYRFSLLQFVWMWGLILTATAFVYTWALRKKEKKQRERKVSAKSILCSLISAVVLEMGWKKLRKKLQFN